MQALFIRFLAHKLHKVRESVHERHAYNYADLLLFEHNHINSESVETKKWHMTTEACEYAPLISPTSSTREVTQGSCEIT